MKKIITVILCFLLSIGAALSFVSCGKTKYDPDNFLAKGTEENPYQIVKDKITLKIFVPRSSSNPQYKTMKMFKKLSELTNVDFDFIEADTSAYDNLRSAQWKNPPDLFLFGNDVAEQVILQDDDVMVAFNDDELTMSYGKVGNLIENYMPTYKALLDNNFNLDVKTNAKKVATLENGKMYSTVTANDVARDLTFKMFINDQWITNLKSKGVKDRNGNELKSAAEIKTLEQLIEVLYAFKKYDANNNGDDNDEIPVSSKSLEYLRNFIIASYGYVSDTVEISADGQSFVFVPSTEAYKKYITTMNQLWKDGIIDKNTFSILSDSQLAKNGYDYKLGMFCSAAAYLVVGMDKQAEYVTFGPITSEYYSGEPVQWGFSNFLASGAVIPNGTNYVREVARLLDIMYSDVGCQLVAYGEEGVDWTWDSEAKESWTFKVPDEYKDKQEDYRATITPNVGTGNALYWNNSFVGKMNDPIITSLNKMSEKYVPYLKVICPEEIKFTKDEYENIDLIQGSLKTQVSYMEQQFITGGKNISTDWAAYQSDLTRYKADELVKIYNTALNRYLGK